MSKRTKNKPATLRQPVGRSRRFLWSVAGAVTVIGLACAVLISAFGGHGSAPEGMVWVPGGQFWMGSEDGKPDERPVHLVQVDGFWMDRTEVTNEQFERFVRETNYVTDNERRLEPNGMLQTEPDKVEPGGMVFRPPGGKVALCDHCVWWRFQKGANWRQPEGPGSSIAGLDKHPVVQVSWNDAVAYCKWRGEKDGRKYRLPTEAEWEFAARGGLDRKPYVWGDEQVPGGVWQANIWQGEFPNQNTLADGFERTAPVASFPANGYGLHDMAGNVWEWCADWYEADYYARSPSRNPPGPAGPESSSYSDEPRLWEKVIRGGSYLCSDSYCTGYRPSARMRSGHFTGLVHTGFRCACDQH
jgi:formylglycine-generating enzyme required for sulfatase activity